MATTKQTIRANNEYAKKSSPIKQSNPSPNSKQVSDNPNKIESIEKVETSGEQTEILLKIGKYRFTTTKQTLTNIEGNYFDSLFKNNSQDSGSCENDGSCDCGEIENGESLFVCRDGKYFGYILDYMRSNGNYPMLCFPQNVFVLRQIQQEAIFYCLNCLVNKIELLINSEDKAMKRIGQYGIKNYNTFVFIESKWMNKNTNINIRVTIDITELRKHKDEIVVMNGNQQIYSTNLANHKTWNNDERVRRVKKLSLDNPLWIELFGELEEWLFDVQEIHLLV